MKFFLESMDKGVWDAVVNGPFQPIKVVEGITILKEFSQWTLDENNRAYYDVRAKNIMSSGLTLDEFYRVFVCESDKDMWDVLEVTHGGTDEVSILPCSFYLICALMSDLQNIPHLFG